MDRAEGENRVADFLTASLDPLPQHVVDDAAMRGMALDPFRSIARLAGQASGVGIALLARRGPMQESVY